MTLAPGVRLGVYEIVALVGSGGMGEVYRARDARLQRDVAIKIIRNDIATDDARTRFEREARAVAALSHPNILAVHDIGNERGRLYLVMELLDGETLRARLERGPLAWRKAVEIAIAIADALAEAHVRGIVHRDLKPANIFLTSSGLVKVVDFGLAKLHETAGMESQTASQATARNMMGTAPYMAPEQVAAKTVDGRADLFALGCVLFEMLSGRRAFDRSTSVETMAAILNDDAPDIAGVLPELQRTVAHCLEKHPDARFQSARDLAFSLRSVFDLPTSSQIAQSDRARGRLGRRVALATGVVAAAALLPYLIQRPVTPASTPSIESSLLPPDGHTFLGTPGGMLALSPDGSQLAFTARGPNGRALWLRPLDASSARRLDGTDGADMPFWSPDGRWLAFFAGGKLLKVAVTGSRPLEICETGPIPVGGAWSHNNMIVFASNESGALFQVPAEGGHATPTTELNRAQGERSHRWPMFVADTDRFVFTSGKDLSLAGNGLLFGEIGSQATSTILPAASGRAVHVPGYLLYLQSNALMAVAIDDDELHVIGKPVLVAERVITFSATENTLVIAGPTPGELVWVDRGGEITPLPIRGSFVIPELSHDGRQAATRVQRPGSSGDIWVYDLVRGVGTPITTGPADDSYPIWSPDDSRIAFGSNRRGHSDIYAIDATGTGKEELLYASDSTADATSWSPDGRHLIFNTVGAGSAAQDLWSLSLSDKRAMTLFKTPFRAHDGRFSPDGRWFAYTSDDTGRHEIYVQPFPPTGKRWRISTSGGIRPKWVRNMKELIYLATDTQKMTAVEIRGGATFKVGTPRPLFDGSMIRAQYGFDMTADGQRFLIVRNVQSDAGVPVTLIQNWKARLTR